jgi:hypothetical protein
MYCQSPYLHIRLKDTSMRPVGSWDANTDHAGDACIGRNSVTASKMIVDCLIASPWCLKLHIV